MKFVIRVRDMPFPYPELGPRGSELEGYIPADTVWKQLNYGQGEGQVEIGGCEWGFYQTGDGDLAIYLHTGECSAREAFDLIGRIAELTCNGKPFEILAQGTWEDT